MIYFLLAEDVGRCKIGFSEDPRKRCIKINYSSPVQLELLGTVEGSREDEKSIHSAFDWLQIKGEWFFYCSPLIEFIESSIRKAEIDRLAKRRAEWVKHMYQCPLKNHINDYFEWDSWYGDYLILFGKYSGLHLCELISTDYGYIDWMLWKAPDFPTRVVETIAYALHRISMVRGERKRK